MDVLRELGNHFRIGLGLENVSLLLQVHFDLAVVRDYSVVHHQEV